MRASYPGLAGLVIGAVAVICTPLEAHADSAEANALLATAYDLKARGNEKGAFDAFEAAREAGAPAQRISLELAYMYLANGNRVAARTHLEAAVAGPDLALAAQARRQLDELPSRWWADFYAEAYGWSRARGENATTDLVPTVRARGLRRLLDDTDLSAYLFAQATRDVQSRGMGAAVPRIYADNSALLGGGFLVRVADRHVGFFAQAGPALALVDDGGERLELDLRAGSFVSFSSAACYVQGGIIEANTWCAELYTEAIYTSRFDNDVQGFLRARSSFSYLETGPVSWQAFLELRAGADINGDYYDNMIESGMGARWRLHRPLNIDLLTGGFIGSYLGRQNVDPAPNQPDYMDIRILATTYVELD